MKSTLKRPPASDFSADALAAPMASVVMDRIGSAVWVFDIDRGRVAWANAAALDVWSAASPSELYARDMTLDMSPAVARRLQQYQADFIERDAVFTEMWTLYPKGVARPMRVRFSGLRLEDGRMGMLCDGSEDLSLRPEALRSADALLHSPLMISLYGEDGHPLYLNPAARTDFGGGNQRLEDRFVHPEDHSSLMQAVAASGEARLIARMQTADGMRWHELMACYCLDPVSGAPSILISESDVSELKEAEALAQRMARQDPLTGLANRLALPGIFHELSRSAARRGAMMGVFFIDLDGFKVINDTLGHPRGDALLIEVAGRLSAKSGAADAVVRLGGDEFLVIATQDTQDPGRLTRLADDFHAGLAVTVEEDGRSFRVTPSIGLARYPEHGRDIETLMQCADLAMYDAKLAGRNRLSLFEPRMREDMEQQQRLRLDLRRALDHNQFEAYYQPRFSPGLGRITAVEALARWNHPERGLVMPADFIALCEETGLIDRLGLQILDQALAQQQRWRALGLSLSLSVNVSLRQLSNPAFGEHVAALLLRHQCVGSDLELELTETLLVEGGDVVHRSIEAVRALGVRIAIDDFGTGYSNLARLSEFSVDAIKIDRSLIRKLPQSSGLVEMVIELCRLMNASIVAEGIETDAIADWTARRGCHELQGYLFGKPMPAAQMQAILLEAARIG